MSNLPTSRGGRRTSSIWRGSKVIAEKFKVGAIPTAALSIPCARVPNEPSEVIQATANGHSFDPANKPAIKRMRRFGSAHKLC